MQKWISEIDAATAAASQKVVGLQKQIQENEAAITQAKLDKQDAKAKDLNKQNKQLWSDLNAAKKSMAETTSKYVKSAPDRVKQYDDMTSKALADLKAQGK